MPDPQRHIGALHLRLPGDDAHAGPRIADHLTRALAELPAPPRDANLGALRLRVRVGAGASEADIARAVAAAIANL